jgi:hypothetical protein
MIEEEIIAAIGSLVGGRIWMLIAPIGSPLPFITFQQVGGVPTYTFCGNTNRLNARIQFNVWSRDSVEVASIMLAAEAILTEPPLRGVSQGAFVAEYSEPTSLYGARQDFSFWR